MKNSGKIALGGIIGALSSIIMLFTFIPFFTYAAPAIAGCLLIFIVIEADFRWALAVYVIVSIISFMFEKEAAVFFILFFGYYPIIKSFLERTKSRIIEWVLKLLIFNAAVISGYFLAMAFLGIDTNDIEILKKYGEPILLVLANFAFLLYDICVSRMVTIYVLKLRSRLRL